jgi:transcriptional regulator with XRE-family HTH domain
MTTQFDELMQDPEFRKLYAVEGLLGDAAQMIADLLEQKKMKKADLARLLNKTPAFVSQLLNGHANMTVRTLAEVVYALGAIVKIHAEDEPALQKESSPHHNSHVFHFPETCLIKPTGSVFRFEDASIVSGTHPQQCSQVSPRSELVA